MSQIRCAILMALCVVLGLKGQSHASYVDSSLEGGLMTTTDSMSLEALAARLQIMQRLIEMGRDPEKASEMAFALTEEDLDVLGANPRMMQEAGAMKSQVSNFWISFLVIVGLFALLAAGDGTFVQS
ncbi:MAG: hypothetical protein O7G85_16065 [Planctomycetota bacterium]|nr:hypothetical protein [Planctomycetota bacterium]